MLSWRDKLSDFAKTVRQNSITLCHGTEHQIHQVERVMLTV